MKARKQNTCFKVAILIVTVLLCLPCSAKQEIKLALDIPISTLNTKTNADQFVECFTFTSNKQEKSLKERKKPFSDTTTTAYDLFVPHYKWRKKEEFKKTINLSYSTPIYILNQQYRI